MKRLTDEEVGQFNSDFVKMFTSSVGLGLVILGYTYTHTFFRSFGLSLFQLKMEWIDILFRGVTLIQDWLVAGVFVSMILLGSWIFSLRHHVRPTAKVALVSLTVFGLLLSATWGGQALGYKHARAIWATGAGKPAFCRFDEKASALAPLIQRIDELSRQQRIRLIHQSKEHTYLAPVFDEILANQTTGESYVVPTQSIVYCRIVGS